MKVEKDKAIKRVIGDRTYYFCMESCARTFENPEQELKALKRRVSIALSGVVVAAIMRAAFFLAAAAGVSFLTWAPFDVLPWLNGGMWMLIITLPVQVIGGWTFYVGAAKGLRAGRANMDLLIAMGTTTAFVYSALIVLAPWVLPVKESNVYFEVAVVIIAFVLLGKYMEELIKKKSSAAVRRLMDLRPAMATLLKDGKEVTIPVVQIVVGDVLMVRPGERVPADGVVVEGRSAVDEKMVTGESVPVEKQPGSSVIGGTVNGEGLLTVRAARVGEDAMLSQIIRLVEEAQATSAPIQRLADKVSAKFVPAVILVALGTLAVWWIIGNFTLGILSFIGVLIISCPCALGIATPTALLAGTSKGAEMGILIRGAQYLEKAQDLTIVVFDKTGTLTKGEPSVTNIVSLDGRNASELLRVAASAERGSEHPLAKAIVSEAEHQRLDLSPPTEFQSVPGKGVRAEVAGLHVVIGNRAMFNQAGIGLEAAEGELSRLESEGKTSMLVAIDGKVVGVLALADTPKAFAGQAVQDLEAMKVQVVMLTGDNERTARAIASRLGIKNVIANVLPADKAAVIKRLQGEGNVVAMVGDGINDAPALATADLGIALGSGSDVAKETGGLILIKNDVRDVVAGIKLSKATMRKIRQNLFWALAYNTGSIPLAAAGLLNPVIAAAAMALSSLTVVGNAATLRRLRIPGYEWTESSADVQASAVPGAMGGRTPPPLHGAEKTSSLATPSSGWPPIARDGEVESP